jgi:PhoPQ-activated pathogenicity-related protein
VFKTRWHMILPALAVISAVFVVAPACIAAQSQAQTLAPDQMLLHYVNAPDPTYKWEKGPVSEVEGLKTYDIVLTSQTWRGIVWQHLLRVYEPPEVKYPGWMTLFIVGGSGKPEPGRHGGDDILGVTFAAAMQAPVAVLDHVPNQPLFGDLVEDQIISYTFQQYIKDGDPTWPLLFPMTKSAVRAMDALQAYAKQEWGQDIGSFMVMGASKRGWTTWLTAVADPKRVKMIAPMVIDTLDFQAQFEYEKKLWGRYSDEVTDYTSKGLTEVFDQPRGRAVWDSVDPYTFRKQLTLPKLLVLGSNDPYWPTGALNVYWDGLLAPKYILYAPNSGHGLDDRDRVFNTVGAFFRTEAANRTMPDMSWSHTEQEGALTLTITAPQATGARAWVVESDDLDFRPHAWSPIAMAGKDGAFIVTVRRPEGQNIAVYGEADFAADDRPYTLSTQMTIVKK